MIFHVLLNVDLQVLFYLRMDCRIAAVHQPDRSCEHMNFLGGGSNSISVDVIIRSETNNTTPSLRAAMQTVMDLRPPCRDPRSILRSGGTYTAIRCGRANNIGDIILCVPIRNS